MDFQQVFIVSIILILMYNLFKTKLQTQENFNNIGTTQLPLKDSCHNPYLAKHSIEGVVSRPLNYKIINDSSILSKIRGIKYIYASESNSDSNPKSIYNNNKNKIFRNKYHKSHMIEHRQPGLIIHRYSYNDNRVNDNIVSDPSYYSKDEKANLQELPLNFTNLYHAKVPKYFTQLDDYYEPSRTKIKNNDVKDIKPRHRYNYINKIKGHNPQLYDKSDNAVDLFFENADRSKISMEKYITAQNIEI
jgi:hypothetical protein